MSEGFTCDSLTDIAHRISEFDSFVICGHVSPDGDCVGSQLALSHALRALGKEAQCILVKDEKIEEGLTFLPGAQELVPAQAFVESPDVFIAVDVPTLDRIGQASEIHTRCKTTITIDHHGVDKPMSDLNYVDPRMASTTMIIWNLIAEMGVAYTPEMAICAYTGLMTDTGGFRFQNADAASFEAASQMVSAGANPANIAREVFQTRSLASLKLESLALDRLYVPEDGSYVLSYLSLSDFEACSGNKVDADPIINTLRELKGARVACMLREQDGSVRGSIRAKDDTDVAAFARQFKGGGHKAAAGFTIFSSLEEAVEKVKNLLPSALSSK
ncbi:MAG: DHH family phosphoesterase [Raoultibacter sp.]